MSLLSRAAWTGFELAFRPWMRWRLDGVHIRGLEHAGWLPDLPILLVANHVSWWDGFLLREIQRRLRPRAPFHVVMPEDELRRHPLLRLLGAVPFETSAGGARRLLHGLRHRTAARSDAVIGLFPQGRIWPSHRRPLDFQRGTAWLAGQLSPVAVVPVGIHIQPLTRPAPAAFVSVGRPFMVRDRVDPFRIEREVAALVDGVLGHIATHGEEAADAWAASA